MLTTEHVFVRKMVTCRHGEGRQHDLIYQQNLAYQTRLLFISNQINNIIQTEGAIPEPSASLFCFASSLLFLRHKR